METTQATTSGSISKNTRNAKKTNLKVNETQKGMPVVENVPKKKVQTKPKAQKIVTQVPERQDQGEPSNPRPRGRKSAKVAEESVSESNEDDHDDDDDEDVDSSSEQETRPSTEFSSSEESSDHNKKKRKRRSSKSKAKRRKVEQIIEERLEELTEKLAEKKREKTTKFKYPSNREQFDFNDEVLTKLKCALKKSQKKGKKKIKEAIKKIERRNKLIRMADGSKAGWRLVEEYEAKEAASDTDDDKKMKKAEKRALQKIKEDKIKKDVVSTKRKDQRFRNAPQRGRIRKDDTCRKCGRKGHWQADCWTTFKNESNGNWKRNSSYPN